MTRRHQQWPQWHGGGAGGGAALPSSHCLAGPHNLELAAAAVQIRVERDDNRSPKTYAVREEFSLILICWVEREKLLFLLFESGFDDAMNMENDNINNSLECLK